MFELFNFVENLGVKYLIVNYSKKFFHNQNIECLWGPKVVEQKTLWHTTSSFKIMFC